MGYTAYIPDFCFRITDAKKAFQILHDAGFEGRNLEECFHLEGFEDLLIDDLGNVDVLDFNSKYRDQDTMFHHLSAVIGPRTKAGPRTAPGGEAIIPFIEWVGEDDYRWRFVFIDGQMQEVDARIEWPYLNEQHTTDITVQPLTLDGISGRSHLLTLIEEHIAYLDAQLRVNERRGGYEHLSNEDIEQLIREEKMTWKAVRDTKRVILNIEAIDE